MFGTVEYVTKRSGQHKHSLQCTASVDFHGSMFKHSVCPTTMDQTRLRCGIGLIHPFMYAVVGYIIRFVCVSVWRVVPGDRAGYTSPSEQSLQHHITIPLSTRNTSPPRAVSLVIADLLFDLLFLRGLCGYEVTDGRVVITGVSVTWNILSWSAGHEFKPRPGWTCGAWYFCPKSHLNQTYEWASMLTSLPLRVYYENIGKLYNTDTLMIFLSQFKGSLFFALVGMGEENVANY